MSKNLSFHIRHVRWWRHITWQLHHDVKTAAILDPPSWISTIFPKHQKTAQNYWKILKIYKTVQKNLKEVKIVELKLIFINGNTNNYKFGKTCLSKWRCHGNVKFQTQQPILPIYSQINFRKTRKVWQRLVESWKRYKRSKSARALYVPPPPPSVWIGLIEF